MNTLLSLMSAAILFMVSLGASANNITAEDNAQPQQQAETHQGHLEHQPVEANESNEVNQASSSQRMRNVTHPKTGHVTQRYVGQ